MPRKPGSAKYTSHLATAIEPEMKQAVWEAAEELTRSLGVQIDPSAITREALGEWLAGFTDGTGTGPLSSTTRVSPKTPKPQPLFSDSTR